MKKGRGKSGKMPAKQTINMAVVGYKPHKPYIIIPVILVILAVLAAACKFGILDRLDEVNKAEAEVAQRQTMLNLSKAKLASYDDVIEKYAHYTYSGMTEEELNRVDRSKIISLLQDEVIPNVILENWSLAGNQLTMNILAPTLQDVNLLIQQLNQCEIVDFSTVRSARSTISS